MTIRHPRLLQNVPASLDEELVDELLRRPGLRIERIVSTGQVSAEGFWYDQAEHEWVVVLSGHAKILYADNSDTVELGPGDAAYLQAHTRHRIAWTSQDEPTVWLAFFWTEPQP